MRLPATDGRLAEPVGATNAGRAAASRGRAGLSSAVALTDTQPWLEPHLLDARRCAPVRWVAAAATISSASRAIYSATAARS
jgi:hypothetical protein